MAQAPVRSPGVAFAPALDEGRLASAPTRRHILNWQMGKTFYTPEWRRKVSALLDRAEEAVRSKAVLASRVQAVRKQFAGML
jgi:hypothetical protein